MLESPSKEILTNEEQATPGHLLVNGHIVMTAASYQKQLSVVLQEDEGTIRDNIRTGIPEATDEEIIAPSSSHNVLNLSRTSPMAPILFWVRH